MLDICFDGGCDAVWSRHDDVASQVCHCWRDAARTVAHERVVDYAPRPIMRATSGECALSGRRCAGRRAPSAPSQQGPNLALFPHRWSLTAIASLLRSRILTYALTAGLASTAHQRRRLRRIEGLERLSGYGRCLTERPHRDSMEVPPGGNLRDAKKARGERPPPTRLATVRRSKKRP